jgi:hypothetical protein
MVEVKDKLSFEDGEMIRTVQGECECFVTALKNVNKEIGPIVVITNIDGNTWALFQLDQMVIDLPKDIEIKANRCVFFESDMIQHCTKFLMQQPREKLLPVEGSLFQLTADVQQLKLMMEPDCFDHV